VNGKATCCWETIGSVLKRILLPVGKLRAYSDGLASQTDVWQRSVEKHPESVLKLNKLFLQV